MTSIRPAYELDPAAPSDAELLAAHHAGDPEAFPTLFWRYRNLLKATAAGVLRNGHDADDAVQDAMVRALRHSHTLRDPAKLSGWLKTLTLRAAINILARSRTAERATIPTEPAAFADEASAETTDPYAAVDLALALPHALDQVHPDLATTWALVVLCDRPPAEVAAQLGIALGTVKSRLARARGQIAETLRETLYGSDQSPQAQP